MVKGWCVYMKGCPVRSPFELESCILKLLPEATIHLGTGLIWLLIVNRENWWENPNTGDWYNTVDVLKFAKDHVGGDSPIDRVDWYTPAL